MAVSDLVMTKASERFQKSTKHAQFLIPSSSREEGPSGHRAVREGRYWAALGSLCFVGAECCLSVLLTNERGPSHRWQPPWSCDAICSSSALLLQLLLCLCWPRGLQHQPALWIPGSHAHTQIHYTHLFICKNSLTENFTHVFVLVDTRQILLHVSHTHRGMQQDLRLKRSWCGLTI